MSAAEEWPGGPWLGVDYGRKRVGVAASTLLGTVHPLGFVYAEPRAELRRKIGGLAADRMCAGLVVGLPLNMDGSEGPSAQAARCLGAELSAACGLPVYFHDERLTSWAAEQALAEAGLSRRRRQHVDGWAAAAILSSFLASREPRRSASSAPDAPDEDGSVQAEPGTNGAFNRPG